MDINSLHVSPKAVTMTPGNPDSITHAFAAEDKKANEVLEKVKAAIDGSGVSISYIANVFGNEHLGKLKTTEP